MSSSSQQEGKLAYETIRLRKWAQGAIDGKDVRAEHFDWSSSCHGDVPSFNDGGRRMFEERAGWKLSERGERFLAEAARATFGARNGVHYRIHRRRIQILDPTTREVVFDPKSHVSSRWSSLVQALEVKHSRDKVRLHFYPAAYGVQPGMSKGELTELLGNPSGGVSTGADVIFSAPIVGGFGEPSESLLREEYWLYKDTPPGRHTQIVVSGQGRVTSVEIKNGKG